MQPVKRSYVEAIAERSVKQFSDNADVAMTLHQWQSLRSHFESGIIRALNESGIEVR